jgi:hypothetical protein
MGNSHNGTSQTSSASTAVATINPTDNLNSTFNNEILMSKHGNHHSKGIFNSSLNGSTSISKQQSIPGVFVNTTVGNCASMSSPGQHRFNASKQQNLITNNCNINSNINNNNNNNNNKAITEATNHFLNGTFGKKF